MGADRVEKNEKRLEGDGIGECGVCGGEVVKSVYPPDPDGEEKVVSAYSPVLICLACGNRTHTK